jgi:hypothetical protein
VFEKLEKLPMTHILVIDCTGTLVGLFSKEHYAVRLCKLHRSFDETILIRLPYNSIPRLFQYKVWVFVMKPLIVKVKLG